MGARRDEPARSDGHATKRLVVIGAGMAAGRMIDHLVAEDSGWQITIFNAEPRGTYNRLMLSPVLAGEKTYDEIVTHNDDFYAGHGIVTRFGEQVLGIGRARRVVVGEKGEVPYDRLVIATGSTPFIIPLPGHDLKGVIPYRDLEDTEEMMRLGDRPGAKAVVIGGGLLGLEAAAGMAARGVDVTVVHIMGHLMERQLDEAAGYLLRRSLMDKGIRVLCQANSKAILGEDGRVRALLLEDGTELPCDLLVMAVGIRPNVALAKEAGLEVGRGVIVDDHMTTSDPDILALGECVEHRGAVFGLVAPLYDQAKVAAEMLMGRHAVFVNKEVSTKLKVTGCDLFSAGDFAAGGGREEIVFSDPTRALYKRLVIEGDRLIGAVMYGETDDGAWFYKLIRDGVDVSPLRDVMIFGPDYQEPLADMSSGRCSLAG
ncbi:FAD-dependent oxidoreductase [Maritimibacter sp. DP1N21-5]|nr:FAD-dependent oxidoreductase [Maritimibacter sp. DP1N21-5]